MVEPFYLALFTDNYGRPGARIWETTIYEYELTPAGDNYRIDMPLPEPLIIDTGIYWVEFYYTGFLWWWCAGADGNMYQDGVDTGYDAFFGVYGNYTPAVEETSWGAVKALNR